MAYPLTGATPSATVHVALPSPHAVQIAPTRAWSRPFATHSRSATVHVWTPPLHHVTIASPLRQWGLAPTFTPAGDSWGVF